MLKFESIGDGNCLYNTEAVLLVHAYQQGLLEPLMKNKEFVNNLGQLLIQVQQTNQEDIKLPGLKAPFTEKSVKKAFDELLTQCVTKGKKKVTDWVKLQLTMAKGLRAQVVNVIDKDQAIKKEITKELSHALNQSIEISWVEKENSANNNSEDEQEDSDDELEVHLSYHFEDMPEIEEKVGEILANKRLKTLKQKQDALRKWFFQGEGEGFNYYLYGEHGITTEAIHSGELELKILSRLFHHVSRFSAQGLRTRIIDGFKEGEQAKKHAKDALIFTTEKLINHWNAELPVSTRAKKILQEYKPQRTQYAKGKLKKENKVHLDEIFKHYDSYQEHLDNDLPEISVAQYCKVHGLTRKQFDENIIPGTENKSAKVNNKQEGKKQEGKKQEGKKQEGKKQEGKKQEGKKQEGKKQEGKKQEAKNKQPAVNKKEKPQPKTSKNKPNSKADKTKNERDWVNYGTMLFALFSGIALISHCIIWPLLLPIFNSLFVGTAIGHNLYWLTSGITGIFSLSLGWLLTEKIHSDTEEKTAKGPLSKSGILNEDNFENAQTLSPARSLFMLYQNQFAQSQNIESIVESNPHLRYSRNRLH